MRPLRHRVAALGLALSSLLVAGCERALFAVANRGSAPPESSAVYAPEHDLALDVYRPHRATRDAPVVVFFYGGGWQRGMRAQYRFVGRRLAQHGVLAIVADYRTYPRVTFPGFVEDGARAVRWARENAAVHGGDPERLFVMGHSAGAQIGGLIATDPAYLRAVGLRRDDLAGFIGLAGPYDFVVGGYAPVFGPRAQWPRAMVQNALDAGAPPLLLVHGERDDVVAPRNSTRLAATARATGVSAELVLLPEGTHTAPVQAFYDPARAPAVLPAVLAFVGAPAAAPPAPQRGR